MFQCKITIVNHTLGNSNWIGEEWEHGRGTARMEVFRETERMVSGQGNRKNGKWVGEQKEWEHGRGTERMGTGQGNRRDGNWVGEQRGWELVRGTERMGTGYGNRKDGNWVFNYSSQENLKKKTVVNNEDPILFVFTYLFKTLP